MTKTYLYVFSWLCIFFTAGCGTDSDVSTDKNKVPAEVKQRSLTLYNWQDYIGSNTLSDFEKETGIHVNLVTFDSELEMLGALQSDPTSYDLSVTSDDTLRELRFAKLLEPLDYEKIPNFQYINKSFLNRKWDPQQKFSVPYMTGTTGVVVNTKYITDYDSSWTLLFDKRYKGKLAYNLKIFPYFKNGKSNN